MSQPALSSLPSPASARTSRHRILPSVLRAAGGDPALAAQIRSMMWGEYRNAGAPRGHSEAGMMVWWDEQLAEEQEQSARSAS